VIAAGEQERDQRRVDMHVAGAHVDQHALHRVRECDDVVEFEDACGALDRVRGAKHGVERLRVVGSLLQTQQPLLHRIEQLAALRDESLQTRLHFHQRFSLRTATAAPKNAASR
jgi:hypothetical protein